MCVTAEWLNMTAASRVLRLRYERDCGTAAPMLADVMADRVLGLSRLGQPSATTWGSDIAS